jgi:hypothetical protein
LRIVIESSWAFRCVHSSHQAASILQASCAQPASKPRPKAACWDQARARKHTVARWLVATCWN